MTLHPECEARCLLKEHKGYDTCARSGVCDALEDAQRSPSFLRFVEEQEAARDNEERGDDD